MRAYVFVCCVYVCVSLYIIVIQRNEYSEKFDADTCIRYSRGSHTRDM